MRWDSYTVVRSEEDALDLLARRNGTARVIAGGTDLIPQLAEGRLNSHVTLVDISSIQSIRSIELTEDGNWIMVGAAATMAELARSELIRTYASALCSGAAWMGAPQIRNVATIGGNVVSAQPAADGTIPLIALGADARVASNKGARWTAVEDLFLDVGKSSVDPAGEMVTHFRFPLRDGRATSAQRLAKRKAFTLPTLLVAACAELDAEKRCFGNVRIAVAPVATIPLLAREAADALRGAPVSYEGIQTAAAKAKLAAHPRDSLRGGAEYRREMVEVLVKRALLECVRQQGVSLGG